jgi:hypothetical protein
MFHFGIGDQHAELTQPASELIRNSQRAAIKLGLANVYDHGLETYGTENF